MPSAAGYLQLRDRAFALLSAGEPVTEDALLRHVFGGLPPQAVRARLLAPLVEDPRFERGEDGTWAVVGHALPDASTATELTALALTVTGPRPARGRVLRICALHVLGDEVVGRYSATVNPQSRVPRYVAERAGLEVETLEGLPTFDAILDDLLHFLDERPICAQEAALAWSFLEAEARRAGRALRAPALVDVNQLAGGSGKPTLGLVARRLGIGFTRIEDADEEARVISLVAPRLLSGGAGVPKRGASVLQRSETASALPDRPGVYVMRDEHEAAVYVGKARRLRERVGSYVHRPLGATRRLEGLASAVQTVHTAECQTDLEALVLEDREIRRLQPRFNTVRQQRAVRLWIRLPPWPIKPRLAAPRLELASGPEAGPGEYVGPFRNEALAEQARSLARGVFDLDGLRRLDVQRYVKILPRAWAFLRGDGLDEALVLARDQHARAVARGDVRAIAQAEQRLALVRDYSPTALLLPADPRAARYAVVRGAEVFVLEGAVLVGWDVLEPDDSPATVLAQRVPRTTTDDVQVVLRWFGAQRNAHLVHLPQDDEVVAADLISDALADMFAD
jgi:DNA polymerase III epsilon subunit-like protein